MDLSPFLKPDPTQQPEQAFQRRHSSEMPPSYMHRSHLIRDPKQRWPPTCAAPGPLAERRESQHASGAMPLQHPDHIEPSLRGMATSPSDISFAPSAVRHPSSTLPTLPAPDSLPGPLPGLDASITDGPSFAGGVVGLRGSSAPSRQREVSEGQSASSSLPAASSAASWVHSQSAQQLTANVKQLAAQVGYCCSRQLLTAACLSAGSSHEVTLQISVLTGNKLPLEVWAYDSPVFTQSSSLCHFCTLLLRLSCPCLACSYMQPDMCATCALYTILTFTPFQCDSGFMTAVLH